MFLPGHWAELRGDLDGAFRRARECGYFTLGCHRDGSHVFYSAVEAYCRRAGFSPEIAAAIIAGVVDHN